MPVARLAAVSLNYLQFPSQTETPLCGDLVLIHGLAASLGFWRLGIVRPLSWLCRLTAYDLRGHGRSETPPTGYSIPQMADDLAALLDHLGLERVHLLGHSFGGAIALLFASRHPERVHSLILADVRLRALQPYHRLRDWNDWPRWRPLLQRVGIELNDAEPEGGYALLTALARAQSHEANTLPLPLFQTPLGGARRNGPAQRWLRLQEATSIHQDLQIPDGLTPTVLSAIRQPVLGLYGEHSPVLPTARALRRLCPHYELHRVRHAGHFFPLTRPRRLARATLRFLATQTGLSTDFEHLFDGAEHEHEHEHESPSLLTAF